MTAVQLFDLVGRSGLYSPDRDAFAFRVKITDARTTFGRVHVLIAPEAGHGTRWVDVEAVDLDA